MEHHDNFRSPIRFEIAVTVRIAPITVTLVTHQADAAALSALTKDVKQHSDALKQALTSPPPAAV